MRSLDTLSRSARIKRGIHDAHVAAWRRSRMGLSDKELEFVRRHWGGKLEEYVRAKKKTRYRQNLERGLR
jgi:hypothetical protein